MSLARIIACSVLGCAALTVAPSSEAQTYTVTDLGTLGGPAAFPAWLSQSYLVGGSLTSGNHENAYRWTPGQSLTRLIGLGGEEYTAFGTNNNGNAVGLSFFADHTTEHAIAWQNGKKIDLGTLPGGDYSEAFGLNTQDIVVGNSNTTQGGYAYHAFVWQPTSSTSGTMQDAGVLPNGAYSLLNAVNDNGQAVGSANTILGVGVQAFAAEHAVLWDSVNGLQDLGTLGGRNSTAWAINNAGQVVGSSDTASGEQHAFLWDATQGMIDLGVPAGYDASIAYSINASGQVTGETYKIATATFGGFVWDAVHGMRDIDSLIPVGGPSLFGVVNNDLGWLAAAGEDSTGEQHVYLLRP